MRHVYYTSVLAGLILTAFVMPARGEQVLHYSFDNVAAGTVGDLSVFGNDGTLEGNPTVVDGESGQALAFSNSRVTIPASDSLTADLFQGSFTLSAWINPSRAGNTWQQIFRAMKVDGASNDTLFINNNGTLSWRGRVNAAWAGGMCETAAGVVPANQWTHVTVTGDGTNFRIYVNGALSQESAFQKTDGTNATYYIGGNPATTGESYAGKVDELQVYNQALSLAEIRMLAARPKARTPSPANGAVLSDTWVNITWTAGDFAVSHDVYLGENIDDVKAGELSTFRGNQPSPNFLVGFAGFAYPDGLVPGTTYYWRIDEVNGTNPDSPWKGDVWSFTVPPRTAYKPNPGDRARYITLSPTLGWTAGLGAKLHSVYFGNSLSDVDNATQGIPMTATTFTPSGPLAKDTTYYWRVDEFDGTATRKGNVWSFTTVPQIPIADPNLAGWWTLNEAEGANALDWSGHDHHGTLNGSPQWVPGQDTGALRFAGSPDRIVVPYSAELNPGGAFTVSLWANVAPGSSGYRSPITSRDDSPQRGYIIYAASNGNWEFWIGTGTAWSNTGGPPVQLGEWTHVAATYVPGDQKLYINGELAGEATGTISLNAQRYLAIGAGATNSAQGNYFFVGMIDDVRIYNKVLTTAEMAVAMRGNPLLAWQSSPANGRTVEIDHTLPLTWSPGDNAIQHDVYFGADFGALGDADASDATGIYRGRQSTPSYTPPEGVEWGGGPYYWRVDEVAADGTISKGTLWSFSVANYLIVDDIESYNDRPETDPASNRIYTKWIDGYGTTTNGAFVGNLDVPLTQRTNVHGGAQAMPLSYDNNLKFSEATLTLTSGQDWTRQSVTNLSLWFRGVAANAAEKMYVVLNGTALVYNNDTALTQKTAWTEWVIPLQDFAAQGVNLTNVTSITIGFGTRGNTTTTGGTGQMYFDDIRLYRPTTP